MAKFFIKRLKPSLQEKYKWSPIGPGPNSLKISDYLDDGHVDGDSVYHAWTLLRDAEKELRVGDVLAVEDGSVHLCTYSGFEEAVWLLPAEGDIAKAGHQDPGIAQSVPQKAEHPL